MRDSFDFIVENTLKTIAESADGYPAMPGPHSATIELSFAASVCESVLGIKMFSTISRVASLQPDRFEAANRLVHDALLRSFTIRQSKQVMQ